MPKNFNGKRTLTVIAIVTAIGGILSAVGTVLWDVAVVAESVKTNTRAIGLGKASDIAILNWRGSHSLEYLEQVLKGQSRDLRIRKLEKILDTKLDKILKAVEK